MVKLYNTDKKVKSATGFLLQKVSMTLIQLVNLVLLKYSPTSIQFYRPAMNAQTPPEPKKLHYGKGENFKIRLTEPVPETIF